MTDYRKKLFIFEKAVYRSPVSGEWVFDCPDCDSICHPSVMVFIRNPGGFDIKCYGCAAFEKSKKENEKKNKEKEQKRLKEQKRRQEKSARDRLEAEQKRLREEMLARVQREQADKEIKTKCPFEISAHAAKAWMRHTKLKDPAAAREAWETEWGEAKETPVHPSFELRKLLLNRIRVVKYFCSKNWVFIINGDNEVVTVYPRKANFGKPTRKTKIKKIRRKYKKR